MKKSQNEWNNVQTNITDVQFNEEFNSKLELRIKLTRKEKPKNCKKQISRNIRGHM